MIRLNILDMDFLVLNIKRNVIKTCHSLYLSILKGRWLLLFILSSSILLFHKPIEQLLDITLVILLFKHVESVWYIDIIFVVIAFMYIKWVRDKSKKNYVPNGLFAMLLLVLSISYAFYRINGVHWEFTSFWFCSWFKYFDIIFVVLFFFLWLYIPAKWYPKSCGVKGFFNDIPIDNLSKDKLEYNNYAKAIADKLKYSWFETSFAVGINGKWGIGKTSFLALLKSNMKTVDNIVELEFNPWRSNTPDAIVNDFFIAFSKKLSPYHSGVSRLISIYMQKMSDVSKNSLLQSLSFISNFAHNSKTIGDLHQDINDALKVIDKKVVVYIDDVDRLDYDEVLEVLRLIRNTANFRNTTFVVAYDRDYLASAIKSRIDCNAPQYIEKIFQLEITLPYFNKKKLREKLAENLKDFVGETDLEWISGNSTVRFAYKKWFPEEWLYSMRDVTRLSNSIVLNYCKVKEEVVFEEFFKLELLHMKFPSVYELLYRETDRFLMKGKTSDFSDVYQIRRSHTEREAGFMNIEESLKNNIQLMTLNSYEIQAIVKLLESVFDADRSSTSRNNKHLSVTYPSKFERYFAYRLFDGALSNVAFGNARDTALDVFCSQLSSWVGEGMEEEVVDAFIAIRDYDSRDDFEKVISAIFYLGNCKSKRETSNPLLQIVSYDAEDLTKKLTHADVIKRYYSNGLDDKEYWEFISGLFVKAKYPFLFNASYIRYINHRPDLLFPHSRPELKSRVVDYLKNYCSNKKLFNVKVFLALVESCTITTESKNEVLISSALIVLKDFADYDLDNFLCSSICVSHDNNYQMGYLILEIYGSWEDFEKYFNSKDEGLYKHLKQFKLFYIQYKANNYNPVPFDFGDMPIYK